MRKIRVSLAWRNTAVPGERAVNILLWQRFGRERSSGGEAVLKPERASRDGQPARLNHHSPATLKCRDIALPNSHASDQAFPRPLSTRPSLSEFSDVESHDISHPLFITHYWCINNLLDDMKKSL
jgi:hypothetical protein